MKGKVLENIVLAVGLLVIGSAVFLMFIDTDGKVAQRINLIFSIGFIFYIAYSYLLSRNLNSEIRDLETHVNNLKEEVSRKRETIAEKDTEIGRLQSALTEKEATLETQKSELAKTQKQLESVQQKLKALEKANANTAD